jgi:hypothetical protein
MPTTKNEALERWKRNAPRGKCPGCGRPVPDGNKFLCGSLACRKKYLAIRQQGTRPLTLLREIAKLVPVEGSRGRVVATLSPCGHQEELPRSKVRPGWRRRCQACAKRKSSRRASSSR